MSRYHQGSDNDGSGHWPAMLGLGLITLATVTNFALAGMTQKELLELPTIIAVPYEHGGRLGVTAILASLGLAVIVGGQLQAHLRRRRRAADPWADHVQKYSDLMSPHTRGAVQLETSKYLTPPRPMVFTEDRKNEESKPQVTAA